MNRLRQNRNRTNPYLRRGEGRSRSGTAATAEISPRRRTMVLSNLKFCSSSTNMDGEESLLDTLFDEESVGGDQDVEMMELEDGELADETSRTQLNQESDKRKLRNKKKKRSKRKRGGSTESGPNVTDINRFVLDTCKRLREKKSYLMWTAAGVLGVSALSDLVKEVDAIQACGGQKTADGRRFRNGGGVLWNIIKARDPNAYKEIMRKGKEFENQFKKQYHGPDKRGEASSQTVLNTTTTTTTAEADELNPSVSESKTHQIKPSSVEHKRVSVHDRMRVPVTYDDLFEDVAAHCP